MVKRILATGGVELATKGPKAIELGDTGFVEILKGLWAFRKGYHGTGQEEITFSRSGMSSW